MELSKETTMLFDGEMFDIIPLRTCPITYGHPTCMTWESFERMCFAFQTNIEAQRCQAVCRGYCHPEGLDLIDRKDVEQLKRGEKTMAKIIGTGRCEVCKEDDRTLRLIKEKKCCASCEFIWRGAHNNPDLLLETLRSVQGDEWMKMHSVGLKDHADLLGNKLAEIVDIFEEDAAFDAVDVARHMMDELKKLRCDLKGIASFLEASEGEDVLALSAFRMDEVNALREKVRKLEKDLCLPQGSNHKDSALLDLALDVLTGKVTGIGAEHIYRLR